MDGFIARIVSYMWTVPPELVSIGVLGVSLAFLGALFRFAGKTGLCTYNSVAVCLANIQVLHVTKYCVSPFPLPLGTILYTTTFLSNNMLAIKYGAKEASKSVALSFMVYAFFALSLIISLMHKPFIEPGNTFLEESFQNYLAIERLFVPSVRLFVASLGAFLISQSCNVFMFDRMGKELSSNAISAFLSGVVDNIVFSFLAFYSLATFRPSLSVLLNGYILEVTIIRGIVILIFTILFRSRMRT
jgi:uncharacterized integral membrane protein (TIGR00697 family)